MKKYSKIFKEDSSNKWGIVKKEVLEYISSNNFSTCEIDYKEYAKSNLSAKNVKFTFRTIFTANLKVGKFNFIPKDNMNCTLYTDGNSAIKFFDSSFELYIIF